MKKTILSIVNWIKKRTLGKPKLAAIALGSLLFATIFEVIVRANDWYRVYPNVDIITHFSWFFSSLLILYVYTELKALDIFEIVLVGHIVWEIGEMLVDKILPQAPHMIDVFFWDGFFDIINGVTGAAVAWGVIMYVQYKRISLPSKPDLKYILKLLEE